MLYSLMIYTPGRKPLKAWHWNDYAHVLFIARHATQFNGYIWKITRLSDGVILSCSKDYPKE